MQPEKRHIITVTYRVATHMLSHYVLNVGQQQTRGRSDVSYCPVCIWHKVLQGL